MAHSRRQFLQGIGTLTALTALPTPFVTRADDAATDSYSTFKAAMETPYAAPLNIYFERVLGTSTVALTLHDLSAGRLLTSLLPEQPLPVASAFKGPLAMYALDTLDPRGWSVVPVEYWTATGANQVPEDVRDTWRSHAAELQALYRALVFSDNTATGAVLGYATAAQGETDALNAFNDWLRDTVGVSQLSGLGAWRDGVPDGMTWRDERYAGRDTKVDGVTTSFDNMMTARDLGLCYAWMHSQMNTEGRRVAMDLLSTIHNNRGANLERLATEAGGTPYSKNGSLETDAGYVVTDAGVMTLPDGRDLLLTVLSVNAP
ncbi:MAG: serine hydrolase, partial [Chloroflexota bacterium]